MITITNVEYIKGMQCYGRRAVNAVETPNGDYYTFEYALGDFRANIIRKYKEIGLGPIMKVRLSRQVDEDGLYRMFISGFAGDTERWVTLDTIKHPPHLATIIGEMFRDLEGIC